MQIDLVALVKRVGKYRAPTFTAAEIQPTGAMRDDLLRLYMRVVREWLRQWQEEIRPQYEATLAEGLRDSVNDVQGAADAAGNALNRLLVAVDAELSDWVVSTEEWHRGQFGKLFTPTGVRLDMMLGPGDVGPTLQAVLADNVSLIRSLNDQMRNGISGAVFRGLTNRTPARDVAREIRKQGDIGKRRAELIASDQLQKLTGRLDQQRQEQLGLTSFEWAHSGKKHPREEHVARNGKVYRWDSPVGKDDPPGFAIRCGCRSRAVVDLEAEAGTEPTPAPAPAPAPRPEPVVAAPPPPAPPAAPGTYRSVVNPAVTTETIRVQKRLALQKQLTAEFVEAARDERYADIGVWRGRSAKDSGAASFSAEWTDEAVSTVAAIKPEIDALADQLKIPRVRGFKTVRGSQNADMGGGIMGLSPGEFNARAAKVGASASAEDLAAGIRQQIDALLDQQRALQPAIEAARDEMFAAGNAGDRVAYALARDRKDALVKEYESLRRKRQKLSDAAGRARRVASTPQSTWRPGDDPKRRPWSVAEYYPEGIDRIRSTIFHEFAHHLHQNLNRRGVHVRPLETRLRELWQETRDRPGHRDRLPSTYGASNPYEWFAESFSLFIMGKNDLVDPVLRELIEGIFRGEF